MHPVEQARKKLQKEEAHLAKLIAEKEQLGQTIEGLKSERSAAVRKLASGDGTQRKVILNLEEKIKDKSDTLDGLGLLLTDAEGERERAKAVLEKAEAEYLASFEDFRNKKEGEVNKALLEQAQEYLKEFSAKTIEAELVLGKVYILESQLRERGVPDNRLFGILKELRRDVLEPACKAADLGFLDSFFPVEIRGAVQIDHSLPRENWWLTSAYAQRANSQALADLRQEFVKMEGVELPPEKPAPSGPDPNDHRWVK